MLLVVSYSLLLTGIIILIMSLLVVKKIIRQLPSGRTRKSWCVMTCLIIIFVIGYLSYIAIFLNQQLAVIDLVVPVIFFFGACFVWFSTFLALQTTLDVMRISDLEQETFTDPLTGIYNRRFMEQRLTEEISKARRYNFQLSVLLFDLDHFKQVNDKHGHQAGDQALIEISTLVNAQLRDSDILSRYGGEEFLIITPNTGPAEVVLLAERLRARIETHDFLKDYEGIQESDLHLTVSIGLASFGDSSDNEEILIGNADRNLYLAKNQGRNRVAAG